MWLALQLASFLVYLFFLSDALPQGDPLLLLRFAISPPRRGHLIETRFFHAFSGTEGYHGSYLFYPSLWENSAKPHGSAGALPMPSQESGRIKAGNPHWYFQGKVNLTHFWAPKTEKILVLHLSLGGACAVFLFSHICQRLPTFPYKTRHRCFWRAMYRCLVQGWAVMI